MTNDQAPNGVLVLMAVIKRRLGKYRLRDRKSKLTFDHKHDVGRHAAIGGWELHLF
jgi:hypothetical protein